MVLAVVVVVVSVLVAAAQHCSLPHTHRLRNIVPSQARKLFRGIQGIDTRSRHTVGTVDHQGIARAAQDCSEVSGRCSCRAFHPSGDKQDTRSLRAVRDTCGSGLVGGCG